MNKFVKGRSGWLVQPDLPGRPNDVLEVFRSDGRRVRVRLVKEVNSNCWIFKGGAAACRTPSGNSR